MLFIVWSDCGLFNGLDRGLDGLLTAWISNLAMSGGSGGLLSRCKPLGGLGIWWLPSGFWWLPGWTTDMAGLNTCCNKIS